MTTTPSIEPAGERPAISHARAAEHAVKVLRDVGAADLAATPDEVYALLDHLTMVIGHTVTVAAMLADQLRDWAELCHTTPTAGGTAQRLERTRRAVGLGIVPDACRLYHRFEDALIALDRRRYRTDRGIPLDLPGDSR